MLKGMKKIGALFSSVLLASSGVGVSDPLRDPPKYWLSALVPEGILKAQGIDFITNNFIPFLISLGLFLIIFLSLLFIIIGGIMWIMGGGDKEAMMKAKNTVTYALIGLALGIGSFIIVGILGNFFGVNLLGTTPGYLGPGHSTW